MDKREPTIRSRELGEGMRAAMARARLNGVQTARKLGWSKSKLSRMFLGTRGVTPSDLTAFFEVCEVSGEERDRLQNLCAEMRVPGWFRQQESRLPPRLRRLIDHELHAAAIAEFAPVLIPELLRTDDYARSVLRSSVTVSQDEAEDRLIARHARQQRLKTDETLACTFYLHEFALRLPVGDASVMSDQLHELLRLSVRSNVEIRIVRASRGVHAGAAGAFRMTEFPDFRPVVHLEAEVTGFFLERTDEIEAYRAVLSSLGLIALDAAASRELIADLAIELYANGDSELVGF
ncbi:helix-turn-helix domain-containing protein [Actinokineospora enzanensis]|uniref:helix-turn-helix domain-containing protein n=1 Tax=Actinokineospora enzanensis TaxID=155975 RepID=UPI000371B590|nr:helix-turn-helix transcriptional regulator [Actinokineospora enzanensis]